MNRYEAETDLTPLPPRWVDPYNLGARLAYVEGQWIATTRQLREANERADALAAKLHALIAQGRSKAGWVSCNVLEQTLEDQP